MKSVGANQPEVSIIVPVFNAADTLERGVQSIFEQTLGNFELIFVNDGSTDQSLELLKRLSAGEERISVVSQKNSGPGVARNTGMKHASGNYLYFMDADDEIEPDLLEKNLELAKRENADMVIFGYRKTEMLTTGQSEVRDTRLQQTTMKGREAIKSEICKVLSGGATFAVWNKLFKRVLVTAYDVAFPAMRRNEDISFTMDAIRFSETITVNPEIYYYYYSEVHSGKYDPDLIDQHLFVFDKFYHLFDDWMQRSLNYQYATRLFLLYFFHSVPFFIVSFDNRPELKLNEMFNNKLFSSYLERFTIQQTNKLLIKGPLFLLNTKKPGLLILATRLKINFTRIFGKNMLRNLLGSPTKKQVNETE